MLSTVDRRRGGSAIATNVNTRRIDLKVNVIRTVRMCWSDSGSSIATGGVLSHSGQMQPQMQ